MKSEALLMGRIFDDRGNRMTPSHARKGGLKYRYYLSGKFLDRMIWVRCRLHPLTTHSRSNREISRFSPNSPECAGFCE